MSEGQVICLDTIILSFVKKQKKFEIAHVSKQPIVDLRRNVLLSINEKGHGMVHLVDINENSKEAPVSIQLSFEFDVAKRVSFFRMTLIYV